jgi:N-methylhydantoinase A
MNSYKLGIDIGGTFTDFVLLEQNTGKLFFGKTLTTYPDPTLGILNGVSDILIKSNIQTVDIQSIVHGTTLVTNAVIERKGAKTGLLTTQGFEDVLEIGREMRYDIYDLNIVMPKPLVPRPLRLGVTERMDKSGNILTPLSISDLEKHVETFKAEGVASVAVCFLHAFTNPAHEQAVGDYLSKNTTLHFSLSSDVMPEVREYERASATVMNAYVQPITDDYLRNLEKRLQNVGFQGVIHIMISSGRLTTVEGARKTPIQLLESGPAGGTMAGVFFGRLMSKPNLLAFDMGGTTAKASMIRDLKPEITNQFEAAREKRFKKGSGLPVRIPVIDMIEIGAGGGSIAHINHLGLLTVGPESAASQPGPACYGNGGENPTVTDADLILGFLNPAYFLGGTMSLDIEAARKAMKTKIADPLSISVEEAAWGIHRIVNENMASAARVHILEKGLDPRRFSMLGFGGAGPVHAFQVARILGSPQLIIPVGAGVTSALGFLVSPIASEKIKSHISTLENMNWDTVNTLLDDMECDGFAFLKRANIDKTEATVTRLCDMRFKGQGHEITIQMPNSSLNEVSIPLIQAAFKEEYILRYGRYIENVVMETVTWRVVVSGPSPHILPQQVLNIDNTDINTEGSPRLKTPLKGLRKVWIDGHFEDVKVYDRYLLQPNEEHTGPAIIEEMESTTVVGSSATFMVDVAKNIIIDLTN